ncbi:hypothetical protein [Streptomyces sp. GBA 94-10 4N24]|nr:hypothetical protein [Streptomyces sp. GBA 94-10 4N24]
MYRRSEVRGSWYFSGSEAISSSRSSRGKAKPIAVSSGETEA